MDTIFIESISMVFLTFLAVGVVLLFFTLFHLFVSHVETIFEHFDRLVKLFWRHKFAVIIVMIVVGWVGLKLLAHFYPALQ